MQLALPRHNLAVPLVTLLLGAAGGAAATAALNDEDIVRLPSLSAPAAVESSTGSANPELRGSKASSTGVIDTARPHNSLGARP